MRNFVNYEVYGLLGCNTVQFGDIPAFWRNISPLSSGSKSKKRKKPAEVELSLLPTSASFLLGLFFDPEYGGDMFLQNTGLSPNYTVLQPRSPYSSQSLL
jgi:hypothetical protein